MRLSKLILENFRGFKGKHEIKFSEGNITTIIGVNGTGKTSVLDAAGIILQGIVNELGVYNNNMLFEKKDITVRFSKSSINANLILGHNTQYRISVTTNSEALGASYSFPKSQEFSNSFSEYPNILPTLLYYRTGRNIALVKDILYNRNLDKTNAYNNVFNLQLDYTNIFYWYLQLVNARKSKRVEGGYLAYELPISAVTEAITTFLTILDNNSLKSISIVKAPTENKLVFVINKKDQNLQFNQLSEGEKIVLGIVMDISYRMTIANPNSYNPLKSDGIVLIDKLENHLHPKWQMNLLKALTSTFPNVQFIVTTHSPLIINQLRNNQLLILDDFKILSGKDIHNTYGRDVNSIVSDFMGASDRPIEVKAIIDEIENILDTDTPNIKLAREKLDKLKTILGPNDYDIIKLETLLTIEQID